jgi:multisubunit Na+/H+ antiporter MnhC subunit
LKRRKVIRIAIVYAVVAWLLVEVASVLFPGLLLPDWSVRLVIGLAIIGFSIALVLAWAVELTPDGPRIEAGAIVKSENTPAVEPGQETENKG